MLLPICGSIFHIFYFHRRCLHYFRPPDFSISKDYILHHINPQELKDFPMVCFSQYATIYSVNSIIFVISLIYTKLHTMSCTKSYVWVFDKFTYVMKPKRFQKRVCDITLTMIFSQTNRSTQCLHHVLQCLAIRSGSLSSISVLTSSVDSLTQ